MHPAILRILAERLSVSEVGGDGGWNTGKAAGGLLPKQWGNGTHRLWLQGSPSHYRAREMTHRVTNLCTQQPPFCPAPDPPASCPQTRFLHYRAGNFHSTLNPSPVPPSHPPLQKGCRSPAVRWPGVRAKQGCPLQGGKNQPERQG